MHAGKEKRLFVAVDLPGAVLPRLEALRKDVPEIRWTPGGLHLTVRFIGGMPKEKLPAVKDALRTVRAAPFSLRALGLGQFARSGRIVLWAGLESSPELLDLKTRVDLALAAGAGLAPDTGRFSPHITLSRLRPPPPASLQSCLKKHAHTVWAKFPVTTFTLFSSRLLPEGAAHTPEEVYALAAPPSGAGE